MAETKKAATKKAEAINDYGQTQEEYEAAHSPEPQQSKADLPDTPSGLGAAAAKDKEGAEAAEAYHAAKKAARWG